MQESDKITYNTYLLTLKDSEFNNDSKIGLISSKRDKVITNYQQNYIKIRN